MWINYIGEIAIGFFILLIAVHFGLHFIFKAQKIKRDKAKKAAQMSELSENANASKPHK